MPTDLKAQILKSLATMTAADRPATFNHLAREFGANTAVVAAVGQQLVDQGLADATYADIRGERKLFALRPKPVAAATPAG